MIAKNFTEPDQIIRRHVPLKSVIPNSDFLVDFVHFAQIFAFKSGYVRFPTAIVFWARIPNFNNKVL